MKLKKKYQFKNVVTHFWIPIKIKKEKEKNQNSVDNVPPMCMPLPETLRSGEQRRRGSSAGCPGLVSPAPHAHAAAPLHLYL
jgi:hypothetical protein